MLSASPVDSVEISSVVEKMIRDTRVMPGFKIGIARCIAREPRKSQKGGHEDQETLKQPGRAPP